MKRFRERDVVAGRIPQQSAVAAQQAEEASRKALINAETDVRELKLQNVRLRKALQLLISTIGADIFSLSKEQRAAMDFARAAMLDRGSV